MKSLFNFRPFVVIFFASILSVMYSYSIVHLKDGGLGIFIILSILILLSIIYIIIGAIGFDKNKFLKYLSNTYNAIILLLLSFFICGAIFNIAVKVKESFIVDINEEVTFSGSITNAYKKDGYFEIELRDVKYSLNSDNNSLHSNLKLIVYGNNEDGLKVGNIITAKSKLTKFDIKSYAYYNYSCLYVTRLDKSKLTITDSKPNLFERIKLRTYYVLHKYMNVENSNIAYAMLFGEKENLDNNIQNSFSMSGISHILAVSGLHIGVLVGFVMFLLKKFKSNKIVKLSTISIILLFYMFLCGFTPSVVRASLMSIILILSAVLGERYDAMSSLALSGIVIFLFNPFEYFSIGFQLSFACVFAIITLVPFITRLFSKIHFKGNVANSIAISMSVNFALIPFCGFYFHRISMLSLLTNLFVLPIFSFTFVLLFVITILSLLIEFIGYLLILPDLLIHFIKIISNFVASIKYNSLTVYSVATISFIIILAFQYILQFMVGNIKLKTILCSTLVLLFCVLLIFDCLPKTYNVNSLICFKQYSSNMVLNTYDNNEKTLIGFDEKDYNRLDNMLLKYRINKIDNLILYENVENIDLLNKFINDYKINNVYIPHKLFKKSINNLKEISENSTFIINDFEYNILINNDKILGVTIKNDDKLNLVTSNLYKSDLITISNILGYNINVLLVYDVSFDLSEIFNYNVLVTQSGKVDDCLSLDKNEFIIQNI